MSAINNTLPTFVTLAELALQGNMDTSNLSLVTLIALGKEEYEKLGWMNKANMDRQVRKALTGKAKSTVHGPYGSNKKFEYNELDIRGTLQAMVFIGNLDLKKGTTSYESTTNKAKCVAMTLYGLSGQLKADSKKAKEDLKKEVDDLNKALKDFNPDHKVKVESDVSNLASLGKVVAKKAKASVGIKENTEEGTNLLSKGSAWASAKVVCGKDNRIIHNKEAKLFLVTKYVVPGTTWYKAIDSHAIPADIDFEVMEAVTVEFKYE